MNTAESTLDEHASSIQEPAGPSYDDINTPMVVMVGVISAVVTLLTIMFVQGVYYNWQNSFVKSRTTEPTSMRSNLQIAEQKSLLTGEEGIVSIQDAMQKIVDEYGN